MSTISLFHGTTKTHADAILKHGFSANTCFTTDISVAEYFAECANDEHQDTHGKRDDEVILSVSFVTNDLKVDWVAFEEPISIFRNEWAMSDSLWNEGIESGEIPYPQNDLDTENALKATTCVRCIESVPADKISEI